MDMTWRCATCRQVTETCYTDTGVLGMVHGQCLCRACYVADGHPACPQCADLTVQGRRFCAHCGFALGVRGADRG